MKSPQNNIRPSLDSVLTFIAGWLVVVTISTVQMQLAANFSWIDAIKDAIVHWGPWLLLTPIIFLIVRFYSFQKDQRFQSVAVHLFSSFLIILLAETISSEVLSPILKVERRRPTHLENRGNGPFPPPRGPAPGERRPGPNRPPPPGERSRPSDNPPLPKTIGDTVAGAQQWLPVYWALVILRCFLVTAKGLRDRERQALKLESQLVESRLDTLKLQLQPHFLFNTLNATAELIHRDPQKADEMICQLSTLLRAVLDERDTQEVSLHRELELLRAYVSIESVRFGNRLSFEEDIDPNCMNAYVPVLFLQPIVENAVRHGIEPLDRPGTIWISIKRVNEELKIVVSDDGRGRQGTDKSKGWGIGLKNATARLSALHAETGFDLEAKDREGGGTIITITLPFITAPAEPKDTAYWECQT